MKEEIVINQTFANGAIWLRSDFHLHTLVDSVFLYEGNSEFYYSEYVNKLIEQDIKIAAITNHNKFNLTEFKALEKTARKKEIFLLPGVELSVNDGANGIHCLIVFDPIKWLENGNDFINQFLTQTFAGKANYENENGRTNDSLFETINKLNAFNRDYFIIMAHVEQKSGFYNELDGGRITEFGQNPNFKKAVLGFQKVRTRDYVKNLELWLDNKLPAFVEGSDPKCIEEIGKGRKTYLKIGAYNFEATKYALIDKDYRKCEEIIMPANGYIKSISFSGGKLDGKTIHLNHSMNNLIGIRGSGKSSILEAIRYALDIELDEKQNEGIKYKNNIINNLIGSGGKISCTLIDQNNNEYTTEKTLGDSRSNIFKNDELQIGLKPDAIVKKPIYYGQKDLSKIGDSKTTEFLIGKLIGNRLVQKKREIDDKNQEVLQLINEIDKIDKKLTRKQEFEAKEAELKLKIQTFKDNKIDEKLEKQISFNKDANFLIRINKFETEVIDALDKFIQEYQDRFENLNTYVSKQNIAEIEKAVQALHSFESIFTELSSVLTKLIDKNQEFVLIQDAFTAKFDAMKEEFSEEKRKLKLTDIKADDYVKYNKELDIIRSQLGELDKLSKRKSELKILLQKSLVALQHLWHNEFEIIKEEIKRVNDNQPMVDINGNQTKTIELKVGFRENKEELKEYLKTYLRGSNLRENNIQSIVDSYSDLITIYGDISTASGNISSILSENQFYAFKEYFQSNLSAFLTYRTPDKFEFFYRGRPINDHSLGQRASALIIFLLTLKDSDIVIIDQPEDDLDNQTIYNDVIKVLRDLKNNTQFIFATHNPNIPVLGDCEQVITCHYHTEKIDVNSGSIDNEITRKDIVNIMEGGKEAFNNRKIIYELWTH
jgi:chromosome segregation protein